MECYDVSHFKWIQRKIYISSKTWLILISWPMTDISCISEHLINQTQNCVLWHMKIPNTKTKILSHLTHWI